MIHLLIYVNVTFKSYLVFCKGLKLWTLEQVIHSSWSPCPDGCPVTVRERVLLQAQFSVTVPESLTEKSHTKNQWLCCFEYFSGLKLRMGCGGFNLLISFHLLFTLYLSCSSGPLAGSVCMRPEGSAAWWGDVGRVLSRHAST